jgi:hypothetical protein
VKSKKHRRKQMSKPIDSSDYAPPEGTGIVTALQQIDKTEEGIQGDFDHFVDKPTNRQQVLLENLDNLLHSLRGPEHLLDRTNYSRPFPPKPPGQGGGYGVGGAGGPAPADHKTPHTWLGKFIHK